MKTFVTLLIVALLIVAGIYYLNNRNTPNPENNNPTVSTPQTLARSGEVVSIDSTQVAADGPYLITFLAAGSATTTVAVPSMGLLLCDAYERGNIVDINTIQAGDTIEVRGTVDEDGSIVPCEDSSHYLRILSGSSTPSAS